MKGKKIIIFILIMLLLVGGVIIAEKVIGNKASKEMEEINGLEKVEIKNGDIVPNLPVNNFVYSEWNTQTDGKGNKYLPGSTFSEKSENTLYAISVSVNVSEYMTANFKDVKEYKGLPDQYVGKGILVKNEVYEYIKAGTIDDIRQNNTTFEKWLIKETNAKSYEEALNTPDETYGTLKNKLEKSSQMNIKLIENIFNGKEKYSTTSVPDKFTVPIAYRGNLVTAIGNDTFNSCKNLSSVNFLFSTNYIGDKAFANCENLKEFIMPLTLRELGNSIFANCSQLTSIKFQGTTEKWNAIKKGEWDKDSNVKTVICTNGEITL